MGGINRNCRGGITMSVRKYKKGENKQLSKNFKQKEFDCHCSCSSTTLIDDELVSCLQKIRDIAKKPVNITSAYRCPINNRLAGGVSNSKHCQGMAADIQISGLTPNEVAIIAEKAGCRGILRYTGSKNFVHIDTRPTKYWGYTTNGGASFTAVSTFGTVAKDSCPYAEPKTTLKKGNKGNGVKWLQWKLNKQGYKLTVDGDFGAGTETAVKDFQKKKGLTVDGVVGANTRKKLNA